MCKKIILVALFPLLLMAASPALADDSMQTVKAVSPNPAGVVAHYAFEGNVSDSAGGRIAAEIGNPGYKTGVFGQAIELDGVSGCVNCGNRDTFNLTEQLTVAAWIKVKQFDTKYQTIVSKGDDSWRLARAGDSDSIEFACNGTATTEWNGEGEVPWAVTGTTSVNDGKWHHVAGVFDGSALCLYIDGALEGAKAAAKPVDSSDYEVRIGDNAQVPDRHWNGLIDDVAVYNYGLSQAEIVSLMGKSEIHLPEPVPARLYDIAKKYDGLKKYEEAKGVCELIAKRHPDSPHAAVAQMYVSKRDIFSLIDSEDHTAAQAAVEELRADFAGHPNLPEVLYAIAERYGKREEGRSLYEQIVQLYPDSPYAEKARYHGPEIHIFSLISSGKYAEAEETIDRFAADFAEHPAVPGALYWFAKHLDAAGKYKQARDIYQHVAWQYPDSPLATKALIGLYKVDALSFIESGDDSAARKVLDNLIADFSDKPELAETVFTVGEKYYYQATSKRKNNRTEQAKECYAKALAAWQRIITELPIEPTYTAHAYYFCAACHRRLGEHREAIECFQEFVNEWPDHQYAWSAQCLIGECYEKLRDFGGLSEAEANPKIEQAYQAVVENYGDCCLFGHACVKLGQTYERMGNLDLAAEMYRVFIETADAKDPRINGVKARLAKVQGEKK